MTNFNLDARRLGQDVASHHVLRADLGEGRSVVVISGIALPEFTVNDDDRTNRQVCRLNLREPAELVEQHTLTVGLAAISNDETAYVFATDESALTRNEDGELVLETHLAVLGENTGLHRFSYQVVVVNRVVAAEITGTLSWPTSWLRPASPDPSALAGVFSVVAHEQTYTSEPSGGGFGSSTEHLVPVATGQITAVTVTDQTSQATYRISDPPKDRQLRVVVEQQGLAPTGGGQAVLVPTPAGGDLVRLSIALPSRGGVDFTAQRLPSGPA